MPRGTPAIEWEPGSGAPGETTNGLLRYPIDDIEKHHGRISFRIIDEDAARADIGKQIGQLANAIPKESGDIDKSAEKAVSGTTDFLKGLGAAFTQRMNGSNSSIRQDAARFSQRDENLSVKNSAGGVTLYLPQSIQIQDAASYENMDLGRIGAGVESALASGGNAMGAFANEAAGQVGDVASLLKGGSMSGGLASLAAQSVAPAGSAGAIASATGVSTNPNTRALFKAVPLRQFAFSFELVPSSAEEARICKDIVKWFRTELYPEALSVGGGINYGYKFPNRFRIRMTYRNKADPDGSFNGIKFLPVYLQSFNATYNNSGQALHADGNFQSISIAMNFMESRALTRQDIERYGY